MYINDTAKLIRLKCIVNRNCIHLSSMSIFTNGIHPKSPPGSNSNLVASYAPQSGWMKHVLPHCFKSGMNQRIHESAVNLDDVC